MRDFLQSLITNDIRKAESEKAIYAALLSPQGKYLHDFFIVPSKDALLLDCEAGRKDDLIRRLSLYRLRARVTLTDLTDALEVIAIYRRNAPAIQERHISLPGNITSVEGSVFFPDPRLEIMGGRCFMPAGKGVQALSQAGFTQAPLSTYDQMRMQAGVPDGSQDFIIDRSLPLELGMDRLNGISFTKGCYVGQEVTARSKHRATLHKTLYRLRSLTGKALPDSGTPIMAGAIEIGQLRSHLNDLGLAILRREEVEKATQEKVPLTADGIALEAVQPEWVQ